jgi:peptide/nickel transport system ATP-binding protein
VRAGGAGLVTIRGLTVTYQVGQAALRDVDLDVGAAECLAVVGESGSGKTTLARVLLGLLPPRAQVRGSARVAGTEVVAAPQAALRRLRGRTIGYVPQDPYQAAHPLHPVGHHVAEAWRAVGQRPPAGSVAARLAALGIPDPPRRIRQHPHQWSGGMLQRATMAAAGVHQPPLTVADEPTSALDDELAAGVLAALRRDARALLLITHDLRRVLPVADRIAVMHAGEVVEVGPTAAVRAAPRHPHTRSLIAALPAGRRVDAAVRPAGPPVVAVAAVSRVYRIGRHPVPAVREASLAVHRGELVGIHGRSGSGKSTLLRLLAGIERPDSGTVQFASQPGWPAAGWVMPVFQDSRASLDPRWPVARILAEPVPGRAGRGWSAPAWVAAVRERLAEIGLPELDPLARPPQLSSGQCQRIAVLRALLADPALIVADEPTSGLDTVNAARVAALLRRAADRGVAAVVVSHDLDRLASIADRIHTMRDGVLS